MFNMDLRNRVYPDYGTIATKEYFVSNLGRNRGDVYDT